MLIQKSNFVTNRNKMYLLIKCFICFNSTKVLISAIKFAIVRRHLQSGISVILFNDRRNDMSLIHSLAFLSGGRGGGNVRNRHTDANASETR